MIKKILLYILRKYQKYLSPDHSLWAQALDRPPYCKHIPSCSDYMIESLEKKGVIIGFGKGVGRVMRCNPWSKGGYDPVEKGKGRKNISQEEIEIGEEIIADIKNDAKEDQKFKPLIGVCIFGIILILSLIKLSPNVILFLNGIETMGVINKVEPMNTTCGSKHYDCTKYDISIILDQFESTFEKERKNSPYYSRTRINPELEHPKYYAIGLSSIRGHNQPISASKYQVGQRLELIIDPKILDQVFILEGVKIKDNLIRGIKYGSFIVMFFFIIFVYCSVQWIRHKKHGDTCTKRL